jgi:hypothetical protein
VKSAIWWVALVSGLFATMVRAETLRFRGYAYDTVSGRHAYTEVHEQHIEADRWLGGSIRYYDARGELIGRKELDFSAHPTVPRYRFDLMRQHYVEGIREVGADYAVAEKIAEGKTSDKRLPIDASTAADSGFHAYVLRHFEQLLAGRKVELQFIVSGRLAQYRFRVRRVEDGEFGGRKTVRLIVEPDSLLRLLVDPIKLAYDEASRLLVEYQGISNVHDPSTGKAYNVRIIYPDQPPADIARPLPPLEEAAVSN